MEQYVLYSNDYFYIIWSNFKILEISSHQVKVLVCKTPLTFSQHKFKKLFWKFSLGMIFVLWIEIRILYEMRFLFFDQI